MAFTAEQKRERRTAASQQQHDDEAASKRKRRRDNAQQEHAARKQRRGEVRAAADVGDEQAKAILDAAARRNREYRDRIKEQADADAGKQKETCWAPDGHRARPDGHGLDTQRPGVAFVARGPRDGVAPIGCERAGLDPSNPPGGAPK